MNTTEAAIYGYNTAIRELTAKRDALVNGGIVSSHIPADKATTKVKRSYAKGDRLSEEGRSKLSNGIKASWDALSPRKRKARIKKMNEARLASLTRKRAALLKSSGGFSGTQPV
jgi:hypothetical protein